MIVAMAFMFLLVVVLVKEREARRVGVEGLTPAARMRRALRSGRSA